MAYKRNRLLEFQIALRAWRLRNSPGDRLQISATVFVDKDLITDDLLATMQGRGLTTRHRLASLPASFGLPTVEVESRSAEGLQSAFVESLATLRDGLRSAAIDPAFLDVHRARVVVYTTIHPKFDMGDVILERATLEEWQDLGASFRFDVVT
jgi:hypothetical protein